MVRPHESNPLSEVIMYSNKTQKINNLGMSQERNLILTTTHIYSFKKKSKEKPNS